MSRPDQATLRQHEAAHPQSSVWLTANAGSGKTKVLTDRVARLLLEGVEPQNVLCLTYTKAAAAEMQNRLFRRLGEWAMLADEPLRAELVKLGVEGSIARSRLGQARTLFARALETPGGLRIQTIHAFCAALLRRFPLEAGVSPQFTEMEERQIQLLRGAVVEAMAEGPARPLVEAVLGGLGGADLDKLTAEIVAARDAIDAVDPAAFDAAFGLAPGDSGARLLADVFDVGDARLICDLAALCATGSTNDVIAARKLIPLAGAPALTVEGLAVLESVFLFGKSSKTAPFGAKINSFPTAATRARDPALIAVLEPLMLRVQDSRDRRMALAARDRTLALIGFARAFLPAYDLAKRDRGALDFDDLIRKARGLLNDPSVAQWVLYRLDGGIDHILVDEAQDTSPAQWQVIDRLTQEFGAGEGARAELRRTVFVVGDRKQSIYSFQGADPDAFDAMQGTFARRLAQISQTLLHVEMQHSFRSAPVILDAVDRVLGPKSNQGLGGRVQHLPFHQDMPGRIDLWPALMPDADTTEDPPWHEPVDRPSPKEPAVRLAETIAAEIERMKAQDLIPGDKDHGFAGRPVTEGDILILVQRRSRLFAEIIRACKARGLRIAGADRLRVGAETAVRDIAATLRFLALPEDDLSLAEALRSPLFGWSEQDLFTLAHHRGEKQFLWHALRGQAERHGATLSILRDLLDHADFLRPHDLIARILIRHDGRRNLLARLGPEAEDGIDVLLSQALAYEHSAVPSLTGFLDWMQTEDVDFKRQMDAREDRIRVMTVHGAKGLESPIVILPDTFDSRDKPPPPVLGLDGAVAWSPKTDDLPPALRDALDARRARDQEERQRLLYVAMTRAEKWLIICGAKSKDDAEGWLPQIEEGLRTAAGAGEVEQPTGVGLRLVDPRWALMAHGTPDAPRTPPAPVPFADYAPPAPRLPPLTPSGLGGAKALAGEPADEAEMAMQRGTWLHLLLEHLPDAAVADRPALGEVVLSLADPPPDGATARALIDRVCALIADPALSHLFAPGALTEVAFAATLPELGGRRIEGAIDRLIVGPDRVTVIDYKSNRVVPAGPGDVPEGILRQMGAYVAALRQTYPDRAIEAAVLWTETGEVMPMPHDLVNAALGRSITS